MTGRHLLIVAHGSRRGASNDEVRALGARIRDLGDPALDHVDVAFLELAEPSIPEALARLAPAGAREIVVFPHVLAAGTHVAQDIPAARLDFQAKHPDILVRLTPHLGASPSLAGTILEVTRVEVLNSEC